MTNPTQSSSLNCHFSTVTVHRCLRHRAP